MNDRRLVRHLAIMAVPAIATWVVVTGSAIGMSPDSLFYWSAARTIHATRTVATQVSARDYARTIGDGRTPPDPGVISADGSVTYPLTTWPPGYPLAIAALMPLTRGSVIAAARLLALITLLMLIGAFALVASELLDPRRAAFAAALTGCLPFVHFTVRMMWSDALFAALALIALAFAARSLRPATRPGLAVALAATVAALATYVRYTGPLVFAAAILVVGLVAIRDPRRRVLLVQAMLAIAIYALLVAPLFVRNVLLTGHATGGERSPAEEPVTRLLAQFVIAFARGFVPWTGGTLPGPRDGMISAGISLAAWGVACAAVLIVIRRTGAVRPWVDSAQGRAPMALILVVFAVLYSTVLLALRMAWHFDFNTRMLLPAVGSVALLAAYWFERRITDGQLGLVNSVAIIAVSVVTVVSLAAADHYASWRGYNHPDFLDRPVARWARAAWTQAESGPSVRFLGAGYMIPYLHVATGGAPVAALPDVPEPSTLRAPSPGTATVVILEPGARRFPCPEYQVAYQRVLDAVADSTVTGQDFSAWWFAGASAAQRPARGKTDRWSFRCTDRH